MIVNLIPQTEKKKKKDAEDKMRNQRRKEWRQVTVTISHPKGPEGPRGHRRPAA